MKKKTCIVCGKEHALTKVLFKQSDICFNCYRSLPNNLVNAHLDMGGGMATFLLDGFKNQEYNNTYSKLSPNFAVSKKHLIYIDNIKKTNWEFELDTICAVKFYEQPLTILESIRYKEFTHTHFVFERKNYKHILYDFDTGLSLTKSEKAEFIRQLKLHQHTTEEAGQQQYNQNMNKEKNTTATQGLSDYDKALAVFMITPPYSMQTLRQQYKRLIKAFHPDENDASSTDYAAQINTYYELLKKDAT